MKPMKQIYEYSFKGKEPHLWGQERAREIRPEIEAELDSVPPGAALRLDLSPIKVMDSSFAVELFGRLYTSMASAYPERALVLMKVTGYVKDNLDSAFKGRGLLGLTVDGTHSWRLVGKTSETDRETLEALYSGKQMTAPELASALNIGLTTCNQRLKKLADAGIIIRTRISAPSGGDQFMYRWPV
jgi:hypothetical protein